MCIEFRSIQQATYTEAEWTAWDGVLKLGQHAISSDVLYPGTDQPMFKIGNGTDVWTDLDYVPAGGMASTEEGIIAEPGGGQTNATVLSATHNMVDTVGTTGDSVKCSASIKNATKEIFNNGANDMDLFPAVGDRFKVGTTLMAIDAALSIGAGNGIKLVCYSAGVWRTM